jgi:hypothetical protein
MLCRLLCLVFFSLWLFSCAQPIPYSVARQCFAENPTSFGSGAFGLVGGLASSVGESEVHRARQECLDRYRASVSP